MPIVKEGNISIYPNPVNSILLIDGIQGNTTITVYDLAGKMLSTINTSKDFELNVSDLQIGMYFIKIGSNTLKFIKE
jgi:myo-inositol-hexaphosphate 3-phosphohydrolase